MASVTHGGADVISNSEGGWVYTPGHKGNARQVRKLARATRARVAEMALDPAPHKLSVTWVGSSAGWSSFKTRLANLYAAGPRTLSVPGNPSVDNVVFIGQPTISEERRVTDAGETTVLLMYEIEMELVEL